MSRGTSFNYAAYNHHTDRDNLFNQTDFVYKGVTGPFAHTFAFGTEFGRQTGIDYRSTGVFPNGNVALAGNPFDPTYYGNGQLRPSLHGDECRRFGVDANNLYRLNIQSGYVRDTVEITRWIQLIGGGAVRPVRFPVDRPQYQHRARSRRHQVVAAGRRYI
ncbi:MAG: hypothetical protein WDN48_12490 [Pseudolabrys sp.]